MKRLLKDYFDLQKKIYDYFGYKEDWVVIPINDALEYYWYLDELPDGSGKVHFASDPFTVESVEDGGKLYTNEIYTQRFLPRYVYRADDFTMICVDTHTDGNKFLQIFDNSKKLVNPSDELKEAFESW
jgi:hypothetical protein